MELKESVQSYATARMMPAKMAWLIATAMDSTAPSIVLLAARVLELRSLMAPSMPNWLSIVWVDSRVKAVWWWITTKVPILRLYVTVGNRVKAACNSTLALDIREWLVMGIPIRVKVELCSTYLQALNSFLVLPSCALDRFVLITPPFPSRWVFSLSLSLSLSVIVVYTVVFSQIRRGLSRLWFEYKPSNCKWCGIVFAFFGWQQCTATNSATNGSRSTGPTISVHSFSTGARTVDTSEPITVESVQSLSCQPQCAHSISDISEDPKCSNAVFSCLQQSRYIGTAAHSNPTASCSSSSWTCSWNGHYPGSITGQWRW